MTNTKRPPRDISFAERERCAFMLRAAGRVLGAGTPTVDTMARAIQSVTGRRVPADEQGRVALIRMFINGHVRVIPKLAPMQALNRPDWRAGIDPRRLVHATLPSRMADRRVYRDGRVEGVV